MISYVHTYATSIYPPIPIQDLDQTPEFEDSAVGRTLIRRRAAEDDGSDLSEGKESEDNTLLPPEWKPRAGRPKKKRLRGRGEMKPKRALRCGNCGEVGHNQRGCRGPPIVC